MLYAISFNIGLHYHGTQLYTCHFKLQYNLFGFQLVRLVNKILTWLRQKQNCCHFADDIFRCIFLNENVWILICISLKFVPKVPIDNNPSLVQIMAWRRGGDKPLSEPMMPSWLTHICITRPQWVHSFTLSISSYPYTITSIWKPKLL